MKLLQSNHKIILIIANAIYVILAVFFALLIYRLFFLVLEISTTHYIVDNGRMVTANRIKTLSDIIFSLLSLIGLLTIAGGVSIIHRKRKFKEGISFICFGLFLVFIVPYLLVSSSSGPLG